MCCDWANVNDACGHGRQWEKYHDEIWESLKALWSVWVPSQLVNFAFVPRHFRVPWGDASDTTTVLGPPLSRRPVIQSSGLLLHLLPAQAWRAHSRTGADQPRVALRCASSVMSTKLTWRQHLTAMTCVLLPAQWR